MSYSSDSEKILLIGTIPEPTGGIAQHVWRLAMRLSATYGEGACALCDIHPRPVKFAAPGVRLLMSPLSAWRRVPWLIRHVARSRATVVHLHISAPAMLAVMGPLFHWAGRRKFRMVTLHHGKQEEVFRKMRPGFGFGVRKALQKFDRIVCLSDEQRAFYLDVIGLDETLLYDATSHVSLPLNIVNSLPEEAEVAARDYGEVLFVVAGLPKPYHLYEQSIALVDELRAEPGAQRDVHLAICLYGKILHPEYLKQIEALAAERPYIHLYFGLKFPEFMGILRRASLLLRPATNDSYGIVVADAIALGVPAVVSDVCPRHPGALLFTTGDYDAFKDATRAALADLPALKQRLADQDWSQVAEPAVRAYDDLLNSSASP